jgi:NAD(P)H-dependent flavin oxidoreductase YrpB (nitropropane dioxygenase family)
MHDPLYTRLCEEYGCEFPIVAFAHTKDVVAAATNAGGIGMYGASLVSPEELRSEIRWIKERVGDRPYGIDITLPSSYVRGNVEDLEAQIPQGHRDFVDRLIQEHGIPEPTTPPPWGTQRLKSTRDARAKLEVMIEEQIPIFASGLGSPAFILDEMHAAGIKVWGLVGMARQAQRELAAGLDLIIAQGQDSAGHTGKIGTFSLVPEVVQLAREHDTPVLAAGGVTSGQHIVAALALGAAGVWTGTVWQVTHESETPMWKKQRMVEASAEDAVITLAHDGKRIRQMRNKFTAAWDQPDAPAPLPMPLQGLLVGKMEQAFEDHELEEWLRVTCGQGLSFINSIRPTRQVILDMVDEARDALDRMGFGADET